jgi:large subunit ribosomal protein L24
MAKIRKGDNVIVTTGKYKGKVGSVMTVFPSKKRVTVSGVNVVKKHTKATKDSEGGIISKELPIHVSNVAHVDPKSGKATKIGYKTLKDGAKERFAKASGEIIKKVEGK